MASPDLQQRVGEAMTTSGGRTFESLGGPTSCGLLHVTSGSGSPIRPLEAEVKASSSPSSNQTLVQAAAGAPAVRGAAGHHHHLGRLERLPNIGAVCTAARCSVLQQVSLGYCGAGDCKPCVVPQCMALSNPHLPPSAPLAAHLLVSTVRSERSNGKCQHHTPLPPAHLPPSAGAARGTCRR